MKRITRRRFVGQSLATTAAVAAAPYIAKAQGSNSKLGVVVVGVNGRGNSHIGGFIGDDRTVVAAIAEVDEYVAKSRAEQIAKKQGFAPKVFRDMREAFDADGIDIVTTATPNHWHALCGIWAMQAGKDTYIEKPVCHNIAEGSALIAASRKYKKMCQVGYPMPLQALPSLMP